VSPNVTPEVSGGPGSALTARALCEDTWLIGVDGCTGYLVVGDERGILIDTGFGTEDVHDFVQKLTNKPVTWVANTHGHFDHTGGNGWFDLAFMSVLAGEIAKNPYPSKARLTYPLDYPIQVVGEDDRIDLGGRDLEVIEIPAHAPSSVAFLDRERRIMFTGDEVAPFVMLYWQQDEPQPSIEQYVRNLEKLQSHRAEFDHVCWGHGEGLMDASILEDCLGNARQILGGAEGEPMGAMEDGPEDFVMYRLESKRVSQYKESHLGYDVRYIFDR
jgi:hydroxyacylglutathione hydrolase